MLQSCEELIGESGQTCALRRFVEKSAERDDPVLLMGEPGVGKELTARSIHYRSKRRDGPFLMIDCSLYYERELKREIFGYCGSGPSAKSRKGLFEFASSGTCYLSRVEELTPPLQEAIWDFLRSGRFRRLGDGKEVASTVRLVVSTERNLRGFVDGGLFHSGLWECVARHSQRIVPLRERSEDIALLVDFYARTSGDPPTFTSDGMDALRSFPWPRNVDELRREIERVVGAGHRSVSPDELAFEVTSFWKGLCGDPDVRRVIEELDGYIREFRVLSRLDEEFGDILLHFANSSPGAKYFARPRDDLPWGLSAAAEADLLGHGGAPGSLPFQGLNGVE